MSASNASASSSPRCLRLPPLRAAARGAVLSRWPRACSRSSSSAPCWSPSCRCSAATWRASSRGERVVPRPRSLGPLERLTYRAAARRHRARARTGRPTPARCSSSRALFWLALYLILRTQTLHPFNPEGFHSGTWDLTFNTASSFVTNTNWQFYGGETTMSYFSQMAGLAVQNFVSAAVGIVVAIALIRGIAARRSGDAGARQLLAGPDARRCSTCCCRSRSSARSCSSRRASCRRSAHGAGLARGPVASQEIIKELGTNGGGFFNVNSAMPFENPNGLTNFLEMLAILVHPGLADLHVRAHGRQPPPGLDDLRARCSCCSSSRGRRLPRRAHGTPAQHARRRSSAARTWRARSCASAPPTPSLWTAVTTVTSCGAVNAAFESLTGIGGLVPMANLAYGETRLRRRRHRPLHDAALRPARRLHRRPDGRPHARVPGQEDRGARDQARRRSGCSFTPLAVLLGTSAGDWRPKYGEPSIFASGPAGLLRVAVRLHVAGQQQRLGVRRLHRLLPARRPATSAPTASRSPTCSAA